jgi:hypothetical protein
MLLALTTWTAVFGRHDFAASMGGHISPPSDQLGAKSAGLGMTSYHRRTGALAHPHVPTSGATSRRARQSLTFHVRQPPGRSPLHRFTR